MRARNIKPKFFKNADLADLGPLAQLLFAGLWCLADRRGRLEYEPRFIKSEVFPYYEADVEQLTEQLCNGGFTVRYRVNQREYLCIPRFLLHQSPHKSERRSEIPDPPQELVSKALTVDYAGSQVDYTKSTVDPPVDNGGLRSDSLIPDSLIPESGIMNHESPLSDSRAKIAEIRTESVGEIEKSRTESPKPPDLHPAAAEALAVVRAKIAASPKVNGRSPPRDVAAQLVAEAAKATTTAEILGLLTVHRTHLGKPGRHSGPELEGRLAAYDLDQQRTMLLAAIAQRKPDMQRSDLTETTP